MTKDFLDLSKATAEILLRATLAPRPMQAVHEFLRERDALLLEEAKLTPPTALPTEPQSADSESSARMDK